MSPSLKLRTSPDFYHFVGSIRNSNVPTTKIEGTTPRRFKMDDVPACVSSLFLLLSPGYLILSIAAILSRDVALLRTFSSHGKMKQKLRVWWSVDVPKQYFTFFYIAGILSAANTFYSTRNTCSSTQWLLVVHLFRRLYECLFVHKFRPESEMHVAGFVLGIGHYLILPLVFLRRSNPSESSIVRTTCCVWNLWMQFEQYMHHKILADTRQGSTNPSSYSLPPNRRWFRWSLCPHYLAEILIYASWAILLAQQEDYPIATMASLEGASYERVFHFFAAQRHWFLLFWVYVNLTVSAFNNRDWYVHRFPKLIKPALFPLL